MTWRVRWHRDFTFDYFGQLALLIARGPHGGPIEIAEPLVFKVHADAGLKPIEPTLKLDSEDGRAFQQALMDSLWAEGIRPSEHNLTVGATEKHLNDMRRIAFKNLGIDFPGPER